MVRMTKPQRCQQILDNVYSMASNAGLYNMNITNIAMMCECSIATVKYHFRSMILMREYVINLAIERKNYKILGVALVNKESAALKMSDELKEETLGYLKNDV